MDEWLRALEAQCEPLGAAPRRRKVLIIDDDVEILDLLSNVLEHSPLPLQISCADDGYDGCARFRSFEPDLVLLDLYMPGFSGERVLEHIRESLNSKTTKVMIITGHRPRLPEVKKLGADACLTKPLDLGELVKTAGALLGEQSSHSLEGRPPSE